MHRSFDCAPANVAGENAFRRCAHDDKRGGGFGEIEILEGFRKDKHKIPGSYSAAGESAASSTETRDNEPLVKANRVRYRNKVTASQDDKAR
jgi:hypothetical protein